MRKLLNLVICCVALSMTATYCEDETDVDVYVLNKSSEQIYCFNCYCFGYKDVSLTSQDAFDNYRIPLFDSIQAGDTLRISVGMKECYDETWQFIVFKQSLMDNHTIDEIKEKNLFDTLFKYNYYELKQRNFTLVIK